LGFPVIDHAVLMSITLIYSKQASSDAEISTSVALLYTVLARKEYSIS